MSGRGFVTVRRLLVFGALALVGYAALLAYAPDVLPADLERPAATFGAGSDVSTLLLLVGLGIAIYGLVSSWVWRAESRANRLAALTVEPPERTATVTGSDLTEEVEFRRAGGLGEPLDDGRLPGALRGVLVDVYERGRGDREAAGRHVDDGRWTDDRYAAAFVSSTDDVEYPLSHRLYAWLYPGPAYDFRARRALREAEAAAGQRLSGYEPPERRLGRLRRLWRRLAAVGDDGGDRD